MITVRFLLLVFLLSLLPFLAAAQSCCQIRKNDGQAAYDKGEYQTAIDEWKNGMTKCSDAAKCSDLEKLIRQAQGKIDEAERKRKQIEKEKKRRKEAAKADAIAFDLAHEIGTKEAYETYLKQYPKGLHANKARECIKNINSTTSNTQPTRRDMEERKKKELYKDEQERLKMAFKKKKKD